MTTDKKSHDGAREWWEYKAMPIKPINESNPEVLFAGYSLKPNPTTTDGRDSEL